MEKKYIEFLKKLCKDYYDSRRPISLQIMKDKLSSKFNLSPEYCDKFVEEAYHAGKLR